MDIESVPSKATNALPTRLGDALKLTVESKVAETDTTEPEIA
jgi:hypothetical protein